MNESTIRHILFDCKSQDPTQPVDPKGLYCDNLDVIEFAEKLELKIDSDFKDLFLEILYVVRDYLPPNGIHVNVAMSRIIAIVDPPPVVEPCWSKESK